MCWSERVKEAWSNDQLMVPYVATGNGEHEFTTELENTCAFAGQELESVAGMQIDFDEELASRTESEVSIECHGGDPIAQIAARSPIGPVQAHRDQIDISERTPAMDEPIERPGPVVFDDAVIAQLGAELRDPVELHQPPIVDRVES